MTEGEVEILTGHRPLPAFVARPDGDGRHPAIIFYMDAPGIREELRAGKSPRSAVDQGFKRAFWSVFDSQITTFIAGVVLFQYGTGPIKGFAVMLMIGIVTSLFTGIFCSKVLLDWIVRGLRVKRLRVG